MTVPAIDVAESVPHYPIVDLGDDAALSRCVGAIVEREPAAVWQHRGHLLLVDAKGRAFTFPIPTYNMTPDFPWESENSTLLFEVELLGVETVTLTPDSK